MPDDPKRSNRGEAAAGEATRVGAELREARQALRLGIDDVAASLKIRRVYLDAIEEGRVRDLPAPAYAIGFVRTYARALGLDEAGLVRRFRDGAVGVASKRADLVFPEPVPERGVPAGAVVLVGAMLAVGGYVGWYQWSASNNRGTEAVPPLPPRIEQALAPPPRDTPAVVAPQSPLVPNAPAPVAPPAAAPGQAGPAVASVPATPQPRAGAPVTAPPPVVGPGQAGPPAAAVPATPPARAADEGRVTLRARSDVWVQLRERNNGPVLVNRTLRAGELLNVPSRDGIVLATGNAAGLELLVDGQPVPGFAPGNAVRRDVALDPDRLKVAAIPAPPRPPPRPAEPPAVAPPQ